MTKNTPSVSQLERQYAQAQRRLGQLGYISQGSVQDRTARTGGGAGYQWTRKVAGRTVTVALTPEQFTKMKDAISNYCCSKTTTELLVNSFNDQFSF